MVRPAKSHRPGCCQAFVLVVDKKSHDCQAATNRFASGFATSRVSHTLLFNSPPPCSSWILPLRPVRRMLLLLPPISRTALRKFHPPVRPIPSLQPPVAKPSCHRRKIRNHPRRHHHRRLRHHVGRSACADATCRRGAAPSWNQPVRIKNRRPRNNPNRSCPFRPNPCWKKKKKIMVRMKR